MKNSSLIMFKFITTLFLLIPVFANAQNLLTNGNFEGPVAVGYNVNGSGYNLLTPPFAGATLTGDYAITTNPQPMNTANFIAGGDHTTGTGNMMVIDGNQTGGQQRFWRAGTNGLGISGLTTGVTYIFSYYIKSVSTTTDINNVANIGIEINNATTINLVSGNVTAPLPADGWQKVTYTFVASNSSINIELYNNTTLAVGNDFAIDDLALLAPFNALALNYSVVNSSCFGNNNGSISTYASGGVPPYALYSLGGTATSTNTTGLPFTGLAPGIYTISVKDAANTIVTLNNINISEPANLVVTPESDICSSPITLSVTGGGLSYVWTAVPNDPTLTTPGIANPIVNPIVTTTYTVASSVITNKELAFNGDFSNGNIGFISEYNAVAVNTTASQNSYGIVTNQNTWLTTSLTCGDHTTTTGNFMVVDGSAVNAGANKLWCQKIPVTPNTNYTFSYWIRTLTAGNLAIIDSKINGISIGIQTAPAIITCGTWSQFTAVWNSGISTLAEICLNDQTTTIAGNDFAIDDISFKTSTTCTLTNTVLLKKSTAIITTLPITICRGNSATISFSGTPNKILNISDGLTLFPVPLNASGIGTYSTTALNENATYSLVNIQNSLACVTPITGSILVSVAQDGNVSITSGDAVTGESISTICVAGGCRNLTVSATPIANTSSYTVTSIPYCPQYAFYNASGLTEVVDNAIDDKWSNPVPLSTLLGGVFNFCFYGDNYYRCWVGTNGVVTFTEPQNVNFCPYDLNNISIPNTNFPTSINKVLNAIYGVYQDVRTDQPGLSPNLSVNYGVFGTYPRRRLVANFNELTSYSCELSVSLQTSQIVIYEISNVIDVYVEQRESCTSWRDGNGLVGVQNSTGTIATTPPGLNTTGQWNATKKAYRFSPAGPPAPVTYEWFADGVATGFTTPAINVCPTASTTYSVRAIYDVCGIPKIVSDPNDIVVLVYPPDETNSPIDISSSVNNFDLASNNATILAGIADTTPYTINYYSSVTDASNQANVISNISSYSIAGAISSTCRTIYARIINSNDDCETIKQFTICYTAPALCQTITTPSPTQTLCLNATPTPLSVNTTFTSSNSIKYVYFNTAQTGTAMYTGGTVLSQITPIASVASYTLPTFGAAGSLPNIAGTYYIYAIANPTPTLAGCRPFEEIIVKLNAFPTATMTVATASVCLNSTSPKVTFTGSGGIAPYTFSYTYNTVAATVSTTATTNTITVDIPTNAAGPQTYVLTNVQDANCSKIQTGTVTTTVVPLPNAGVSNSATLGATSAVPLSLFSYLTGTPQAGGVWSLVSGTGGIFNAAAGTYAPTTIATTCVFSYTVTNAPCLPVSSTVTIIVNVTPIPINNPTPLVVCDDNIVFDGVAGFNLHTKDNEVTTNPLLSVRYYLTLPAAQLGGTNEILANPFYNIDPSNTGVIIQTIYVRVNYIASPNGIYSITTLNLEVKPRPLLNLTLTPLQVCDSTLPAGQEPFDLHTKDADIINSQTGVVVNYFATEALALANAPATALLNQNSYLITPTALTQTIWYRMSFAGSGCATVGPLSLIVNSLPIAAQPNFPAYKLCETSPVSDGLEVFNLQNTTLQNTLLAGQVGVSIKFYPSPADALANTNAITTPTIQNFPAYAQTLGIRLTNIATGCFSLSSIDLIVNPLPAPAQPVAPYTVCDVDQNGTYFIDLSTKVANIVNGDPNMVIEFYRTKDDAEIGAPQNIIVFPYGLVSTISTIYVRAINTLTGCVKVIGIPVEVNLAPTLPLTAPNLIKDLVFCDEDIINNQDGKTNVDLTTQTPLLLAVQPLAASNYAVTYHILQSDAENSPVGLNPIVYPATHPGTNNDLIWVRIENIVTKCFKVVKFKLIINTPLAITTPAPLSLCDDQPGVTTPPPTTQPQPATTVFDLVTLRNPTILAGASPANYTINYYLTDPKLTPGLLPINASAFINTSNPQTLFVVITSKNIPAGTGGCRSFTTLTLSVLPIPTPNLNPDPLGEKCDITTPGDLKEEFNLTIRAEYIKNNDPNVTLRYFEGKPPNFTNEYAVAGTNEIFNPTTAQVAGNVWIRVESNLVINSQSEKCYTLVEQKLKVNPLPTVSFLNAIEHPLNTYQICQNSSLLAAAQFNLDSLIQELLLNNPLVPVTPPAVPTVYTNTYITTFYTTAAGASAGGATDKILTPTAYISPAAVGIAQDIYVRVENEQTGCVNAKGTFKIIVNPKPTITLPTALNVCDTDGTNDGFFSYPLNEDLQKEILGTSQLTGFTVTFHESQTDAIGGLNAVADLGTYMGYTHKLWIRVQNNNTKCFEVASSQLNVEMLPEPKIITDNNINSICVDYTNQFVIRPLMLKIKAPIIPQNANTPTPYSVSYQWYEGTSGVVAPGLSTGTTYLVNQAELTGATRTYTVKITSNSSRGCSVTSAGFDVIQSGPAVKQPGTIGYEITNAFEDNQIITALVTGYGTYQYSLDEVDGVKQDCPVFENVPLGTHTIFVHDVKALSGNNTFNCEKLIIDGVQTIDYPHYFTPNGDGTNDFWNISGLAFRIPTSTIYIFNRDGKLIKQISPDGNGWDGFYNNELMPSTDYWFTVDFTEKTIQKQFKSHFSLKR